MELKRHVSMEFSDMIRMGDSVTEWFEQDEKNVIAVHCKGGKGRTGTMICVALLKTGICQTATVGSIEKHVQDFIILNCRKR